MEVAVFYGVYLLGALLIASTLVLVTGGALHLGSSSRDGYLIYFYVPLVLVVLLEPILSGRNLEFGSNLYDVLGEGRSGVVKWIQRGVSLFLLCASIERIVYVLFRRSLPAGNGILMLGFALAWFCCVGLPAAFGSRPSVTHEYFYWLLIGSGLLASTNFGAERAIRIARNSLAVFMLVGLLVLLAKKNMVLEPYRSGLFSFFPWRYAGLSVHPNHIGPLALLLMLCLSCFPFQRRWMNRLGWFAAWVSLLIAQSKTAWLAGLVSFAVIALVRSRSKWTIWLREPRYRLAAQALLVLFSALIVVIAVALGSGVAESKVQKFLSTRAGSDLTSLTGRNEIWAVAWRTFIESPWFGYGPTIWDPYFRFVNGINVYHAHNQIVNVLAMSGIIGLVGFLIFVLMLCQRVWKNIGAYNGFVAGLGVVVLMRFLSEVPFSLQSFAGEALMPALLLVAVAGASAAAATQKSERSN